jgi:REP element-mobilizing transposase RayT
MARPLRLEFEGAIYHLTSRGDRREPIYEDDADREAFLALLAQALERFEASVFAYCLMGNHYHLVLQTHRPNLSRLMRHLNGVYTQRYNRRHRKVGHLLQGRFHAVVVDEEPYFLEVCRYVDLNPVRAGLVRHPREWAWSSYRAHSGRVEAPPWLESAELHRRLAPRAPRREGPRRYAEFVAAGHEVRLWETALSGQIYLGDEMFVKRMQARAGAVATREIPRAQREHRPQALSSYFDLRERDTAIAEAYRAGHTQTAIAKFTGLSVSRVSRLIAGWEAKSKT